MIEGQGLFNLAARNAAYAALARNKGAAVHNVFARSDKPSAFGGQSLGALTVNANTTIKAMFQAAWDKLHEDGNMISDDNIKRLQDASKSDNKEISAERLRQAKAKLRSLRLQAQMAAASGDPKQLRRIAQQAAQAAREVASAARGLAEGIAASATSSDGSAGTSVPMAAPGAASQDPGKQGAQAPDAATEAVPGAEPAADLPSTSASGGDPESRYIAGPPAGGDSIAWGRDQLRQLGDETRAAIAQARGIIAFAAQAARAKRRNNEPEDDTFRQLQQSVNEAAHDLDSALNDAMTTLNGGGDTGAESGVSGAMDTVSAVTTTTVAIQVTTEVTFTANVVV
jgi:hypothetical protein